MEELIVMWLSHSLKLTEAAARLGDWIPRGKHFRLRQEGRVEYNLLRQEQTEELKQLCLDGGISYAALMEKTARLERPPQEQDIVSYARKVNKLIRGISHGTQEQSS